MQTFRLGETKIWKTMQKFFQAQIGTLRYEILSWCIPFFECEDLSKFFDKTEYIS